MPSQRFSDTQEFAGVMRRIDMALPEGEWCLIGGRAVELWANPPQTPDIDILIAKDLENLEADLGALERAGILPCAPWEPGGIAFLKDAETGTEIDVLGNSEPLLNAMVYAAHVVTVHGVSFPVATAEDMVILKARMLADPQGALMGRATAKRKRDRKAIRAIAAAQTLDADYIRKTLTQERWGEELEILRKLGVL